MIFSLKNKHLSWLLIGFSLLVMSLATWGLGVEVEWVGLFYFMLMWWPFIGLLIGLSLLKTLSLPWANLKEFVFLFFCSVVIWVFFEAYNLYLNNWSYIHVRPEGFVRWVAYTLAFATVLPGIFLCSELIKTKLHKISSPRKLIKGWQVLFVFLGLVCALAPLIWPNTCFALIWVAYFLLTEPVNYHMKWPSLTRDYERGDDRQMTALLLAGVLCGFLWEWWNWGATTKWIYHLPLPFLNDGKIYEMPYAGFLGFPPFAVECWVMFHTLKGVWQKLSIKQRYLVVISVLLFLCAVYYQMDRLTVTG